MAGARLHNSNFFSFLQRFLLSLCVVSLAVTYRKARCSLNSCSERMTTAPHLNWLCRASGYVLFAYCWLLRANWCQSALCLLTECVDIKPWTLFSGLLCNWEGKAGAAPGKLAARLQLAANLGKQPLLTALPAAPPSSPPPARSAGPVGPLERPSCRHGADRARSRAAQEAASAEPTGSSESEDLVSACVSNS